MSANTDGPIDRFPILWLSYKKRIWRDLDRIWKNDKHEGFASNFFERMVALSKEADERLVKLMIFQSSLLAFQILGILGSDISLTTTGLTLKNVPGIKEVVLVVYATVGLIIWLVFMSRDTRLIVMEKIVELSEDSETIDIVKLAVPSSFNVRFYFPQQYKDWVFETCVSKFVARSFGILLLVMAACMILTSLAVNVYIFMQILLHPALGLWSYLSLTYAALATLAGIAFMIFFYVPLPYSDQSIIRVIDELSKKSDPSYPAKLEEVYGPNSKYRKIGFRRWIKSIFQK
ncbi:MAG: hypothetical protein J0I08_20730 [Rhizobiales bacterium]|nr:hypothetical protein [Hyphomicrobiales bacterium]